MLAALFTFTVLCSAVLLFLTQPLYGKMILPLLGGAPAVWNTAMFFFQACLLAGYAYAHFSLKWLGFRVQVAVHCLLLLAAFLYMPLGLPAGWTPDPAASPMGEVLTVLLKGVGVPFFLLSASAPLLQRWFSLTGHPNRDNPYFLYAASNIGSMAALLAFPLLLEPLFPTGMVSKGWTLLYILLVAGFYGCAMLTWRQYRPAVHTVQAAPAPVRWTQRGRWTAFAFVPSAMLLAVTNHITTDVAAVPLFWVLPLALYLLTFIIVFSAASRNINIFNLLIGFSVLTVMVTMITLFGLAKTDQVFMLLLHLSYLFAVCLLGHYRLMQERPEAAHLTEYYLCMSLGGMLGGLATGLLAPVLFDRILEYPLLIAAAGLLAPAMVITAAQRRTLMAFAIGCCLLAMVWFALYSPTADLNTRLLLLFFTILMIIVFLANVGNRRWYGASMLLLVLICTGGTRFRPGHDDLYVRSFFGAMKVFSDKKEGWRIFSHGTTIHGVQSLDKGKRLMPTSYYHPKTPQGLSLHALQALRPAGMNIGIIGLGTGTAACLARQQDAVTYYEIDPAVVSIAQDPALFTYWRDCPPKKTLVLGDARLSMRNTPDGGYDWLLVDAFSGDAIPAHLLTREAITLFRQKMRPDGMIIYHISNRYLDLVPLVAALAGSIGHEAWSYGKVIPEKYHLLHNTTLSVAVVPPGTFPASLAADKEWKKVQPKAGFRVWTDDYSNILSVLRR